MKLKAQDLQIGDWVLYENEPNIITEVSEIVQGEAEVCFAGTNYMATIDEIKPIPITPEILKVSGFVDCHTIGEKYILKINLDKKVGGENQVVSYSFGCGELSIKTEYSYSIRQTIEALRIKYVHQLQQAMRLCQIRKGIKIGRNVKYIPFEGWTEEEKQLLFKDLCMRLPYGVKVKFRSYVDICEIRSIDISDIDYYPITLNNCFEQGANVNEVKPYLRPMSSMTEEESAELSNIISKWFDKELFYLTEEPFWWYALSRINYSISPLLFDWLNAHHFDYRGLISKGLAIEVTKENNPYKD